MPPGNGLPRPETSGAKWPWNRRSPPTETKCPSTHPQNCGSAPNAQKRRFVQDCVVGWKDSNLQPDHYERQARWRHRRCLTFRNPITGNAVRVSGYSSET
jgi:hypothetical protein